MNRLLKISVFAFILLTNFVALAQPGGTGDGNGGLEGGDPPPSPIDTRLIYLGIVGLLFAYYAFRKHRKVA
jgi:hypothetical protein